MAQLIAIGDSVVLNLDQITAIDLDPAPGRADLLKVHIFGPSGQLATEVFLASVASAASSP
jgi:hypothetical protein